MAPRRSPRSPRLSIGKNLRNHEECEITRSAKIDGFPRSSQPFSRKGTHKFRRSGVSQSEQNYLSLVVTLPCVQQAPPKPHTRDATRPATHSALASMPPPARKTIPLLSNNSIARSRPLVTVVPVESRSPKCSKCSLVHISFDLAFLQTSGASVRGFSSLKRLVRARRARQQERRGLLLAESSESGRRTINAAPVRWPHEMHMERARGSRYVAVQRDKILNLSRSDL
jgi:hypothetical protein